MSGNTTYPGPDEAGYQNITATIEGPVARITLNRPHTLNALTLDLLRELIHAVDQVENDPVARVMVLTGAGRGFNSGWDRGPAGVAATPQDVLANDSLGRTLIRSLQTMTNTLTVAAFHGPAVGGGVLLGAACDMRISTEDAFFWLPEISFGNPLLWTGIAPLVREIGLAQARYLALSNLRLGSDWALRTGLVHETVPADRLADRLDELANHLSTIPPRGVRLMKADVHRVSCAVDDHHGHSASDVYDSLTAESFTS